MAVKELVASIIQFLTQQLEEGDITADSRESLEVAIQCLESAYNVQASDAPANINLHSAYQEIVDSQRPIPRIEVSPEKQAEAENLKTKGNNFMKDDKPQEALQSYTKAIELDGTKAVYYCNRAAVHSKLGNHQQAIKDSTTALTIDPTYSKAYARMGLAYSSLENHPKAKECYQKASEMEPDNELYKNNIQLSEAKMTQQAVRNMGLCVPEGFESMDLTSMIRHPSFVSLAQQMFTDPGMQSVMNILASGNLEQSGRMSAFSEATSRLMSDMQDANPELFNSLRREMSGPKNPPEPPQKQ